MGENEKASGSSCESCGSPGFAGHTPGCTKGKTAEIREGETPDAQNKEMDRDRLIAEKAMSEYQQIQRALEKISGDTDGPIKTSDRAFRSLADTFSRIRIGGQPVRMQGIVGEAAQAMRQLAKASMDSHARISTLLTISTNEHRAPTEAEARAVTEDLTKLESQTQRFAAAIQDQVVSGLQRLAQSLVEADRRYDPGDLLRPAFKLREEMSNTVRLIQEVRKQWDRTSQSAAIAR